MLRFTVRRPPAGEVSPCSHRPSGGDVACCVHVGVARPGGAGLALENRLALTVLGCAVPARGASLRRVRGRDLLDPAKSLVLQPGGQQAPAVEADRPVQAPFLRDVHPGLLHGAASAAGHRFDIQGLDADGLEPSRDIRGGLFDPVFAPIGLAGIEFGDRCLGTGSTVRAPLRPSRCCNTFNRLASPPVRPGACNSSPVERAAETATPRSMPTTVPSAGPVICSGTCAKAICQRPERSRVIRNDFTA